MQNSNIWRKFNLFGNKAFAVAFLLTSFVCVSTISQAQWFEVKKKSVTGYNKYASPSVKRSQKRHLTAPINFGFFVGGHSSRFIAKYSDFYANKRFANTSYSSYPINIAPKSSYGFSLGFVVNLKLAPFWDVRVLPTAAFYERNIDVTMYDAGSKASTTETQTLESTMAEVPILLKYKSQIRGTMGMYLVAGIKPGVSVTAKKEAEAGAMRATGFDFAVEYGIGIDKFFKFFKFSPEVRFSHGIINNLENDKNVLVQSLKGLTTNSISLYLHFE